MKLELGNVLLFLNGLYHILGGCFSLGPSKWTKTFGQKLYSLNFPEKFDPRYQLTVRSLGAFALFTGVISWVILFQGKTNLKGLYLAALGILFIGRAILRIVQKELFLEAYNMTFERSKKNVIFNVLLGTVTCALGVSLALG